MSLKSGKVVVVEVVAALTLQYDSCNLDLDWVVATCSVGPCHRDHLSVALHNSYSFALKVLVHLQVLQDWAVKGHDSVGSEVAVEGYVEVEGGTD